VGGSRETFADNQAISVAQAIEGAAAHQRYEQRLDIATGYFNLGGFLSIADVLERVPAVRILIGAEPEAETVPDKLEVDRDNPKRAVARVEEAIEAARDEEPFGEATTSEIERLKAFLQKTTTEVRIFRKRFLHGKAYIFGTEEGVIAGSANFTRAGLNYNLELDLGQYDPDRVKKVSDWFEALWNDSERYDLAYVFNKRLEEYDPHTIYLRMLYAQYSPELEEDEVRLRFGSLELAEFQQIGSQRAVRILDEWGGVILADGVGLGKTLIAGDVIRTFAIERGLRILVVCPAALRKMWNGFLVKQNLPGEVISYAELALDAHLTGGPTSKFALPPQQYRLIIADEAHALRNPDTGAYAAMLSFLAKSPEAKLLMLTATPVNNSLWDLYHEVMLFAKTDNAFSGVGIPNLRDHVKQVTNADPDDIDPGHMFAVLDAISVRRTRQFIKTHFPNAKIGDKIIVFPRVVAHAEKYDIDAVVPGLFEEVTDAIEHRLTMARYRSSSYALEPDSEVARQEFLSGLLRSQMLKRFESSVYAFMKTLEKMIAAHEQCLSLIETSGIVPLSALTVEEMQDADELESLLDDGEVGEIGNFDGETLTKDLRSDVKTLRDLLAKVSVISPSDDPKLANLVEILRGAAKQANGDKRKTLVFTSYVDTVRYIKDRLEAIAPDEPEIAALVERAAYVLGNQETDVDERGAIALGFAPKSMSVDGSEAEDLYDLLVTTDVLAEGQNLQQCGRVVNFDLPWNPMRVAQRNGRVDRIGSPHDIVDMHCFMPDAQLDAFLRLEERLARKIAHANAGVGVEGTVIPGMYGREKIFTDPDQVAAEKSKQLRDIAAGDEEALADLDRDDAYSGEQFRQELRAALLSEAGGSLENLPWGIGSGHNEGCTPSIVFLIRAGRKNLFRTVPLADLNIVDTDLLEALKTARCSFKAERTYPAEIRSKVYEAWNRVRESVHQMFQDQRDPAKRQVSLPKAQRDAIDLLQRSPHKFAPDAAEILASIWPKDVERALRVILKDETFDDQRKVDEIIAFIGTRGLKPQPYEETPDIRDKDIKLICYQIVLRKDYAAAGATQASND